MRRFLAASEVISKAAGVTQQQYQALLAISAWGESMTMTDLAEDLLLTHHAAVQLVDRLALANLAQRSPSIVDRRRVELSLTPKGAEMLENLSGQHLVEMLKREPALSASLRRLRRLKVSA